MTGASRGIGQKIAISYARAGAAQIAIGARSNLDATAQAVVEAARAAGKPKPKVLSVTLDVCDRASVAKAAADVEAAFGRLDVVVNNAGYLSEFKPLLDGDEDEWWLNWEINVRGIYRVTKAFLPLLLKGGDKTVLNVSSIGAMGLRPGASGYQTSKYAVLKMSEFFMADYANQVRSFYRSCSLDDWNECGF